MATAQTRVPISSGAGTGGERLRHQAPGFRSGRGSGADASVLKAAMEHVLELQSRLTARNAEVERANARLTENARQRQADLETAARVQAAFLPPSSLHIPGTAFAWAFEPCQELAALPEHWLRLRACRVLCVGCDWPRRGGGTAGGGRDAFFLSVSEDGDSILLNKGDNGEPARAASPSEVATRLNQKFSCDSGRIIPHASLSDFQSPNTRPYLRLGRPSRRHPALPRRRPPP